MPLNFMIARKVEKLSFQCSLERFLLAFLAKLEEHQPQNLSFSVSIHPSLGIYFAASCHPCEAKVAYSQSGLFDKLPPMEPYLYYIPIDLIF